MDYSRFEGKRVLITGASGFIGSHLANALDTVGADVYVSRHYHEPPVGKVFQCDLANREQVLDMVYDVYPEYVFHLAAQAIVTEGENRAEETVNTNVGGTVNLLHALYQQSLNHPNLLHGVIVAASDKVYGRQEHLPYTEEMPLLGVRQVYEASKVCEDVLSQMAAWSWKLPIGISRFGNVYGPGDANISRIIPGTIKAYLDGVAPVIRSDGQAYRDYLFINDVVDGYLKFMSCMDRQNRTGRDPYIFNFGTGKFYRVLDVVAMISEYFPDGLAPDIQYGAIDEIRKQYVSGDRAKAVLGWKPQMSLRDGIAETVAWWKAGCHA